MAVGEANYGYADLAGENENPPVDTSGTGTYAQWPCNDTLVCWQMTVARIGSATTAAHIHSGAPGVNGGVVVSLLTATPAGDEAEYTTSGSFAAALLNTSRALAGEYYVNVHSVNNGGGEVRGQLFYGPNVGYALMSTPANLTESNGRGTSGFRYVT